MGSLVAAIVALAVAPTLFGGGSSAASCPPATAYSGSFHGFASSFEHGFREWHGYGAESQPQYYPPAAVVDPLRYGVPRLDGCHAARFQVTRANALRGRVHAKVIISWHDGNAPPRNVSGSYRAWYFLPKGYKVHGSGWVNIMQWKEPYDCSGYCSDPSWWITLEHGPRGAPVARLNNWGHRSALARPRLFPRGRWVEVRADLRQGQYIRFFIDGHYWATARQSQYPIGPMHGDRSREWGFGVGNYAGHGDGPAINAATGPMYIDKVSIRPL